MLQRSLFLIISTFLFFATPVFSAEVPSINSPQIGVPHLQFESTLGSMTGSIEREVLGFFDSPANIQKLENDIIAKRVSLVSNQTALWVMLFSLIFFVLRTTRQVR